MSNEIATFGGDCFRCIETVVRRLKGVEKVALGYAGGHVPGKPTYREICSGTTRHTKVIQVIFNPEEEIKFLRIML